MAMKFKKQKERKSCSKENKNKIMSSSAQSLKLGLLQVPNEI
jgi:hypothetical protein